MTTLNRVYKFYSYQSKRKRLEKDCNKNYEEGKIERKSCVTCRRKLMTYLYKPTFITNLISPTISNLQLPSIKLGFFETTNSNKLRIPNSNFYFLLLHKRP